MINKGFTEEDILATAKRVFGLGWNLVKLYFMLGLPTETDDDIAAMAELAGKVADLAAGAGVKNRWSTPVWACSCPSPTRRSNGRASSIWRRRSAGCAWPRRR